MSYLVLARKYRPQDFTSVTGQEQVTRTLGNAIVRNKVAHAHLFCGPRGVGKTSIARIFAKALNCEKGPTPSPCSSCANCREITAGTSLAVREIDGASHNSVENVRDLIESFRSLPAPGSRYKVYIIDEVHMLSVAAFNALLKSLEEPPPNTVFILATTEVHKIPETVISRCVRHDFRALSSAQVESRLREVAEQEKLEIEPEVLRMIGRLADGSMRDAQSLLDRVQSFCEGAVTAAEASRLLGTVERSFLHELSASVLERKPAQSLSLLGDLFSRGVDPAIFLKEFVAHWREMLVAAFAGEQGLSAIGVSDEEAKELLQRVRGVSPHDLQDLVHLVREGSDSALRSSYVKYALEALLVRLATREPVVELGALIDTLKAQQGGRHHSPSGGHSDGGGSSGGGGRSSTSSPGVGASVAPSSTTRSTGGSSHPQSRLAAPVSQAIATSQAVVSQVSSAPQSEGGRCDWNSFVPFAATHGARILVEHLKRIAVLEFSPGILKGRGPKFSVTSLKHPSNEQQLVKVLAEYSSVAAWTITLEVSESGEDDSGSIRKAEQIQREKRNRETAEQVSNHPKIKSLQKFFPGSSIEGIKVKE